MRASGLLRRVAAMPATEIRDRLASTMRREAARLAHRARPARTWRRADLAGALVPWTAELAGAITHLSAGRIDDAHGVLSRHFAARPRRWPIAPAMREPVAQTIRACFPDAPAAAVRRADAITDGRFDVLGYRDLRFSFDDSGAVGTGLRRHVATPESTSVDWHCDPVHGRVAPAVFWSEVPYLDPACGDHKIIWELNRHQHFLALGRAWWLAGHRPARATFIRHLASWMDANPPLVGINWASMLELALRSLSWIWALEFFVEATGSDDRPDREPIDAHPWLVDLLLGLDRQLQLVEQNLSTYFSPNTHLLGEALALYVAGRTLPELRRAPARAALGRRVLIEQMSRQISPDGGHVERSFHYHRYTLDFYLLALSVARLTGDDTRPFAEAARRLARFARIIADDRGHLARIGDDDGGQLFPICGRDSADAADSLALAAWLLGDPSLAVGPAPEEAVWMSGRGALIGDAGRTPAAIPSTTLGDSGYTVCRTGRGDHLVIDTGPHGYLNSGHAHADALSTTLTVGGRPLVVDPGTACYTIDRARRDRFRSTRLHNTLVLDGREQSEPAGPFHWASAASGSRLAWCTSPGFDYIEGAHDGYAPLVHRRAVLSRPGSWIVADRVLGDGEHQAEVHWHLDPGWTITAAGDGWLRAVDGGGDPVWIASPDGEFEIVRGGETDGEPGLGWIAPAYGRVVPSTTLRLVRRGAAPFTLVTVVIEATERPSVEALTVRYDSAVDGTAAALRLVTGDVNDTVVFGSTTPGNDVRPGMPSVRRCVAAGHLESDAALLWCRTHASQPHTHIAIVDGSVVRTTDGRDLVTLPAPVPFKETVA
jgi:Heparinase II/III-like protein/Heparinase II/III N-terminus